MNRFLPRAVLQAIEKRLNAMPAVVLTGARQTGKSTLSQRLLPGERRYHTMDDLDVLEFASTEPDGFLADDAQVTLDEVQRLPSLLSAIKRQIDQHKRTGQFLLTGSANLLLMQNVSESLAGRASYLTLWPMTRREQLGLGRCGVWEELVVTPEDKWHDLLMQPTQSATDLIDWRQLALRGGFPTPALEMKNADERRIWFEGYLRTYLERDLLQLSSITSLPDFRRLMRATSGLMGQQINQSQLARNLGLPQASVHRYLNLLETSYMLVRIPAFAINPGKRLTKTPKSYWSDAGLALHLSGSTPDGQALENIVLIDLLVWKDSRDKRAEICHWRTHSGTEVDFLVEFEDESLLPIEVKATTRPRLRDTVNLRAFRKLYKNRARAGLLLHDGRETEWLTDDVLAAPWWRVL